MSLSEDLRSALLADSNISSMVDDRVHVIHVPQGYFGPYIYLGQRTSNSDDDRAFDDPPGQKYHFSESYDIEAISEDLAEAQNLARLLVGFDNFSGSMGSGRCQLILVRDHNEDYAPHGIADDEGRSFAALDFEILGYQE